MTLDDLWRLAERIAKSSGARPDAAFESAGLLLNRHIGRAGYDATPANAETFAGTGGDGVHFSFVVRKGVEREDAPIVMTVPMCFGKENVVVGASLRDFLAVGTRLGFFFLEQLAYERDAFIDAYAGRSDRFRVSKEGRAVLGKVARAFELEPPANLRRHLASLAKRHDAWLEPGIPSAPAKLPSRGDLLAVMKKMRRETTPR